MAPYIGTATSRIDGHAKVTGAAKYAAEFNAPGLAYASVVTSTIAKGRIARIDASAALRVKGVIDVLTHQNRPPMADDDNAYKDDVAPEGFTVPAALRRQDHVQRPADRAGGRRNVGDRALRGVVGAGGVRDGRRTSRTCIAGATRPFPSQPPANPFEALFTPPKPRGKPEQALAAAAVRHGGEYYVPIEHHNPMELYASTVIYEGDGKLTVYDKTQGVQNVQRYLCGVLGMKPDDVRVMSPFVGGAFGSGLRPQYQVVLAALAARALRRSVRLVLTRPQMYALGYRPAMIQQIELGANADGTLDAITHEAITVTSQYEDFFRQETGWSGLLYKCANAKYAHKLARLDLRDVMRHARAERRDRRLCARMRDGRARGRAEARSA